MTGTYEHQRSDFIDLLYYLLKQYNASSVEELSIKQLTDLFNKLGARERIGLMMILHNRNLIVNAN